MGRILFLTAAFIASGVLMLDGFVPLSPSVHRRALAAPPAAAAAVERPALRSLDAAGYLDILGGLQAPARIAGRPAVAETQAGPATLALSRFFPARGSGEAQFWLEATLPDIPNLGLLPTEFARVEIERVQRRDGLNVHARGSRFETGFFSTLALRPIEATDGYFGVRSVRVSRGVTRGDIAYVTGRVQLKLPLEVRTVSFAQDDSGLHQGLARLESIAGGAVVMVTTGRPEAYVTTYAYDDLGRPLEATGEFADADGLIVRRTIRFRGDVSRAEVVFTKGYVTQSFPFVLEGPGARRQLPFGPQPKTPATPLVVRNGLPTADAGV